MRFSILFLIDLYILIHILPIFETEGSGSIVKFEEKDSKAFGEEVEDKDMEEVSKIMTRSMTDAKRKEMRRDEISRFWLQVENREHKLPEVIDAKQNKIENLEKYGVFEKFDINFFYAGR